MEDKILVIGAGQCRTGTNSLQLALERLLGGKCYHMKEVFKKPSDIPKWIRACQEGLNDSEWRDIFLGYQATLDYPSTPFYQEILRLYPEAKVILTVRDGRSWVKSCKATVYSDLVQSTRMHFVSWFTPLRHFLKMKDLVFQQCLGEDFDFNNEAVTIEAFNAWNESVKSTVPSSKLLVFESKEGWKPLCNFLKLPIPDEPYPHVNSIDEFQNKVWILNGISWLMVFGFSAAIGGIAFGAYKLLNKNS